MSINITHNYKIIPRKRCIYRYDKIIIVPFILYGYKMYYLGVLWGKFTYCIFLKKSMQKRNDKCIQIFSPEYREEYIK
jgi:hypothetical protein